MDPSAEGGCCGAGGCSKPVDGQGRKCKLASESQGGMVGCTGNGRWEGAFRALRLWEL